MDAILRNSKRLSDELFCRAMDIQFNELGSPLHRAIVSLVYNNSKTSTGFIKLSLDEMHKLLENKYCHAEVRIAIKQLVAKKYLTVVEKKYLGINHDRFRLVLRDSIPNGMLMINNELSFLGFTQSNFHPDSYLWRDENIIWVNLVIAIPGRKGKFSKLVQSLNKQLGFSIAVPHVFGRMRDIVEKNNYVKYLVPNGLRYSKGTDEVWLWKPKLKLPKKEIFENA